MKHLPFIFFLLLVVFLLLFHLPGIQKGVGSLIKKGLEESYPLELHWKSFRYNLFKLHLEVKDLRVGQYFRCTRLILQPGYPFPFPDVTLEKPEIHVKVLHKGKGKAPFFPPLFILRGLTVKKGTLFLLHHRIPLSLSVRSIFYLYGSFVLKGLAIKMDGFPAWQGNLSGCLTTSATHLAIEQGKFDAKAMHLYFSSTYYPEGGMVTFQGQNQIDMASFLGKITPLQGKLQGEVAFRLNKRGFQYWLSQQIRKPAYKNLSFPDGHLNLQGQGKNLRATYVSSLMEGKVTGVLHSQGSQLLQVNVRGMSIERIFHHLSLPPVALKPRVYGQFTYRWKGWDFNHGKGKIEAQTKDGAFFFHARLPSIDELQTYGRAKWQGLTLQWEGTLPTKNDLSGAVKGEMEEIDLKKLYAVLKPHLPSPPEFTGLIHHGSFYLNGTWHQPTLAFTGNISRAFYSPLPLGEGSGEGILNNQGITLTKVNLHPMGGNLHISGKIPFHGKTQLTLKGEDVQFPQVPATFTGVGKWVDQLKFTLTSVRLLNLEPIQTKGTLTYDGKNLDVALEKGDYQGGVVKGKLSLKSGDLLGTFSLKKVSLPGLPMPFKYTGDVTFSKGDRWTGILGGRVEGETPGITPILVKAHVEDTLLKGSLTFPNGGDVELTASMAAFPKVSLYGEFNELPNLHPWMQYGFSKQGKITYGFTYPHWQEGKGVLTLQPFTFVFKEQTIKFPKPFVVNFQEGTWQMAPLPLWHDYFILELSGSGTLSPFEWSFQCDGYFGDDLLEVFLPGLRFLGDGFLSLKLSSHAEHELDLTGYANLDGSSLAYPQAGIYMKDISAKLWISRQKMVLDHFFARDLKAGTLQVKGRVTFGKDLHPEDLLFEGKVKDFSLQPIMNSPISVDGKVSLTAQANHKLLEGRLTLKEGRLSPQISLVRRIIQSLPAKRIHMGKERALLPDIPLNISLQIPHTLKLESDLIEMTLEGKLHLTGTLNQPRIMGRLVSPSRGIIQFSGVRYQVEQLSLAFTQSHALEPVIHAVLTTRIHQFSLWVYLDGPLSYLKTRFTSEPYLPERDILSLLLGGGTLKPGEEDFGLVTGLSSLFTEELSQQLTRLFGLARIRIEPVFGETSVTTARVTLSRQLNPRCFASYTLIPESNLEDLIYVECQVGVGNYLNFSKEIDGSYAVELVKRTKF